ncbi:unnamed protein product [Dovyalis caffra]|uniref:ribonuclease P n=1 Tax=Dovyalis caffra TaxID=77055 RepID=A0AAV1RNH1_9ROSI|nr:unnamed protein product [Dovyalis caffra]
MACFTSNPLQQKHAFSLTHCKYPSPSLNTCKFHSLSPIPGCSPSKHTPFSVARPHARTILNVHDTPTKTKHSRTRKETNASGISSSRRIAKRVERKHVKNLTTSLVEEKTEKRFAKDKNTRNDMGFRERKEMGSENCTMRSRDGDKGIKSLETIDSKVVSGQMGNKTKKGSDNQVIREEKIGKGSKEDEVDSSEPKLRVRLDMCSKRGDVMGAIQLYDLAQRKGIKMGQYHYAVLLYLCSSAAVGVVQPAKSGSGSRAFDSLDVSNVKFLELSELKDKDDRKVGATELDIQVSRNRKKLVNADREPGSIAKMELNHNSKSGNFNYKESLVPFSNGCNKPNSQHLDGLPSLRKDKNIDNHRNHEIQVSEDVKKYALQRGFEIFEKMCKEKVPMNEATLTAVARMAMSMGNGDLAFDMVKQMKPLGINPKLRSYGPALSVFCSSGDIDKAFSVEKHMLEHGVYPEEPELEALLRLSVEAGKSDKVYYLLHKLRTSVRRVSPSTAGIIVRWFSSKAASRVGKTKWDHRLVNEAIESGGGGWHGLGWLAIKFKCLIVTNDEMRDHTFHLLGNDFFPRWKERHQVHFRITDAGPVFDMPPPCSVVIQESDKGYWHIPIETECEYEAERPWLCITRAKAQTARQHYITTTPEVVLLHSLNETKPVFKTIRKAAVVVDIRSLVLQVGLESYVTGSQSVGHSKKQARSTVQTGVAIKPEHFKHSISENVGKPLQDYKNLRNILAASGFPDHRTVRLEIEAAEELGDCVIDFQI